MSMYAELLTAALATERRSERTASTEELLAELARCRSRLPSGPLPATVAGGVPAAVADHLAYDIALVALCRHLGIDFEVGAFDRPLAARDRLERLLAAAGFTPGDDTPSLNGHEEG
jgi:hypothetical protein